MLFLRSLLFLLLFLLVLFKQSRYDVAKVLNMDPVAQQDTLEAILSELPSDSEWDLSVAVQRGYAKAGLKRYKVDHTLLSEFSRTEGIRETQTAGLEKSSKESFLDASGASGSGEAKVKLENPAQVALVAQVKVLKSAERVLSNFMASLKKDRAALKAKESEVCRGLRLS